jgi:hypothetical protein
MLGIVSTDEAEFTLWIEGWMREWRLSDGRIEEALSCG